MNSYLVDSDGDLFVVDAGPPGKFNEYVREVESGGFDPKKIAKVVITHYHPDHLGNAAGYWKFGIENVLIHADDAEVLQGKKPVPRGRGVVGTGLSLVFDRILFRFEPVAKVQLMKENQAVDSAGAWKVVKAEGHTPGSCALYNEKTRTLITGDAMNTRMGKLTGPNALFTADTRKAWESVRRLSQLDIDTLACGHGHPIPSGAGRLLRDLTGEI
ncbi:MAG: MBL fold metallo-hydrolase [Nitrospirae bacterium]|nr:MBL fold metallo-hydrolase [Nitrospirota bacterium]